MKNLRVAIVHFWYMNRTGAVVLESIAAIFPQADIFIACMNPASIHPSLKKHKIATSPLEGVPGVTGSESSTQLGNALQYSDDPLDAFKLIRSRLANALKQRSLAYTRQ